MSGKDNIDKHPLPVYRTVREMREAVDNEKRQGRRIALVPTMGALHDGHLALIRRAAESGDRVVVSIFVNPLQFGPNEDYRRYPRALTNDVAAAREAGATHIFAPEPDEVTPSSLQVSVDPGPMGEVLEGAFRPGHFRGVCTIVLKLFNIVQPSKAIFGWKDAQQFILLRKMVCDLDLPVEMVALETLREPDGLAMSSRNAYLSAVERAQAPALHAVLQRTRERLQSASGADAHQIRAAEQEAVDELHSLGFVPDYVRVVSSKDFSVLERIPGTGVLLAAAVRLGSTRLIDNVRW